MKLSSFASILYLLVFTFAHAGEYVVVTDKHYNLKSNLNRSKKLNYAPDMYVVKTDQSIEELKKQPGVLIVEPNYRYHTTIASNDPHWSWGIQNTGTVDSAGQKGIIGSDVHVGEVWDKGYTGSRKVIVAVLDTGIDYLHKDLVSNIFTNTKEIPDNNIDDDKNGYVDDIHGWSFTDKNNDPMDYAAHGTHVAGIIGAKGNNQLGTVGVNWNVSILPVKILGNDGSGDLATIVEGIYYAIQMKANVINASWGGDDQSNLLRAAISEAGRQGILFVAAAGNDNTDNDQGEFYPANYRLSNMIVVSSTDNQDRKSSFSNYGKTKVDIGAPGSNIYSTVPEDGYKWFSGTSMATPFVAGAVALLKSINANLTSQDIKQRLLSTCDKRLSLTNVNACGGRINIFKATFSSGNGGAPAPKPTPTPPEKGWKRLDQKFASAHPYRDGVEVVFPVLVPNAKSIRFHLKRLETEDFDVLYLENDEGKVFDSLNGSRTDFYSKPVDGGSAIIRFLPDLAQNFFGFEIDYIEYIPS